MESKGREEKREGRVRSEAGTVRSQRRNRIFTPYIEKPPIQSFYREDMAAAETMDGQRHNFKVKMNRPGPEEERV